MSDPNYPDNQENKWATGQRRFQRHLTDLPLTVSVGERTVEGYCNQIAEAGIGALLAEPLPGGTVVFLRFMVPGRTTELQVKAVVRYQNGFQHGLEFLFLAEGERAAIRQFCRELPSVRA